MMRLELFQRYKRMKSVKLIFLRTFTSESIEAVSIFSETCVNTTLNLLSL